MTEEAEKVQPFPQDLAKITYERLGEIRRALVEEHSASYRWILASLLAVNLGGLAITANADLSGVIKWVAGFSFWLGIALSLLAAWTNQVQTRKFIQANSKLEEFWAVAFVNGHIDMEAGIALEEARNGLTGKLGRWLGVTSFSAFSLGSLTVGMVT